MAFFEYGAVEVEYLKGKDKKLAQVIERIGPIERAVDDNLFSAVVHHIIGQQISTKAQATIWTRLLDEVGTVTPDTLWVCGREKLQSLGTTWKKVDYILDFTRKVYTGQFDIDALDKMTDEEAIAALSSLKGIGVWTAEMILLFCLQRPNIFSFGDLAIQRGVRMVYRHKELTNERFERYRKRFSPYCSTASLYFWAVSGGAIPELTDPAAKS